MSEDELARARAKAAGSEEILPASTVERLKAEHPGVDLHLLNAGAMTAVFKAPPYAEWRRFKTMYMDTAQRPMAMEALCFGCLVYPTAVEFREMLQRKPAIAESFGSRLVALAAPEEELVEKKL